MGSNVLIRQVWKHNYEEEMKAIRGFLCLFPIVSFSTRVLLCPDRVPASTDWGDIDANYATLRQMADNNKNNMVQVGLAFSSKRKEMPTCPETWQPCVWEFNLMPVDNGGNGRDLSEEEEQFLQKYCTGGISGRKLRSEGIHPRLFATDLSGLCTSLTSHKIDICWVVFKGGLDFVALLSQKVQTGLPTEREAFLRMVASYFPALYDMAALLGLKGEGNDGTLEGLARSVLLERDGREPHGAACDSLFALHMFMMTEGLPAGWAEKKPGVLFGVTSEEEAASALFLR
ncbi:probable CCR4-associated factor 1 homolog 10 [Nymphaea colorata]|uniref:probable CCR4-associated factor 1 homolog 10 n=1 Tax=Nymphaea colorata TaxID=210225 RepID=UPI00214E3344|nr:probable CCR4-associated factor 1 homolog 10 [Nymphaea colorata]